jgi:hypothetical protein
MIFLVSGEGPTDLGACAFGLEDCDGEKFLAGPMAWFIDRLVEPISGFSMLGSHAMTFVCKRTIAKESRALPMAIRGKRRDFETGEFFKNARALARRARVMEEPNRPVGAVLFRDTDDPCSATRERFESKWNSMMDGFTAEGFEYGVPMVARPKSEAWLLCALKNDPYARCADLEDVLPGNDDSPNPAKEQLGACLHAREITIDGVSGLIQEGVIDPARIDMPSFNRFKERLEEVSRKMLRRTP